MGGVESGSGKAIQPFGAGRGGLLWCSGTQGQIQLSGPGRQGGHDGIDSVMACAAQEFSVAEVEPRRCAQ